MAGNFFQGNFFYAFVDNEGYIVATDHVNQKRIGVTLNKFNQTEKMANDALAQCEEYYKILDAKGLIERELTPDEKINALSDQVGQLTNIVNQLIGNLATAQESGNKKEVITPEVISPENQRGQNEFVANCRDGKGYIS